MADPTRRELLDRLFAANGQSLTELCQGLAASRQAITKHLRVLEDAGLLSVLWAGREKRHFLNPVPIQSIATRWIHKFQARHLEAIVSLKTALEGGNSAMSNPVYIYETFIRATPDRVWEALTSPEFTRRYFHRTRVASDWQVGSPVVYSMEDGTKAVEGEVLECDPPHRLVISWRPLYSPELADEPPSRVTFEIEAHAAACRLSICHDRFEEGSRVYEQIREGWSAIISSLKSLLETGEPLPVAGGDAS
ncbi:MAG: SRPBCC domain-containing protein [Xanthomonadales bacterium]|nr:SRPBCC domain-containing protein [Xanthomonadales bacterium]